MSPRLASVFTALVALVLLAFVASETIAALHASGVWLGHARVAPRPADPLAEVEHILSRPATFPAAVALRDPFQFGAAPAPVAHAATVTRRRAPPPPLQPVLTAIVWDADPRALVRWKDRDWTIRAGGLFDEFQVLDISRDQVKLARGSETIVLQRKPQGE